MIDVPKAFFFFNMLVFLNMWNNNKARSLFPQNQFGDDKAVMDLRDHVLELCILRGDTIL